MRSHGWPASQRSHGWPASQRSHGWIAWLLLSMLAAGCAARVEAAVTPFTNVRQIAHVGVLAPFEGLYRRSGYSALEGVRTAVAQAPAERTGVIPLALDTSLDPGRAAAKIAASTAMRAVIGPITPQEGAAAAPPLARLPWLAPWAVAEEGFVPPQGTRWLAALAAALGEAAHAQGAQRLLVGGLAPILEPVFSEGLGAIPTIQYMHNTGGSEVTAPLPGDALVWLGNAADGAAAAAGLRAVLPDAPIWLAPWAVDPVFFELLRAAQGPDAPAPQGVYSILWVGPNYAAWANDHPNVMPTTYLMYEAALQATALAAGATQPAAAHWQWRAAKVDSQGASELSGGAHAEAQP